MLLGAGTIASRVTGLARTIVLVGLIGSNRSAVADAFNIANQLPSSLFELISVGILTAVIVPQIVRATAAPDGGHAFISKLLTLGMTVFVIVTGIAMVLAPWLVSAQIRPGQTEQLAIATALSYWCLPQILFYGLYALIGEALNSRRVFGPATWAPVANNLVSIAGFLLIGAVFGHDLVNLYQWNLEMIGWLGALSTAGIAIQAALLMLFWRKTKLRFRLDFRWKGVGLGKLGRSASWTFLMATMTLAAGFFQTWVVNAATGVGASTAVMDNAWLVFMVPYSIIVYSIGTPYFTQLAEHAVAGKDELARADIGRSIRILGFFLVGALAAVAAAAVPASRVFTNTAYDATEASMVLSSYLVGLVPLAVLFIVQRTFYAYGDTRTPFMFTLFQCVLVVLFSAVAGLLAGNKILPVTTLAAAVALGQSIAGIAQVVLATFLLQRRIGSIAVSTWLKPLVRFALIALPSGAVGWGVFQASGGANGWMAAEKMPAAFGAALVGSIVIGCYVVLHVILRSPEIKPAIARLGIIARRRRQGPAHCSSFSGSRHDSDQQDVAQ